MNITRMAAVCVIAASAIASASPSAGPLPGAGDIADLLRTGPGTLDRASEWVTRICGPDTGAACAKALGLEPRWGRFAGQPEMSVLSHFSTGGTVGSTGVAVVSRLASGELRLQIPKEVRVTSARMSGGRMRLVVDLRCRSAGLPIATYGYLRVQWFVMQGVTIVPTGTRARCRR